MANLVADEGGDVKLPIDPFVFQSPQGGVFEIHNVGSVRQPNRKLLTYEMMFQAARGLEEVLIHRHNYFEVAFEIWERSVGRVGGGIIRKIGNRVA